MYVRVLFEPFEMLCTPTALYICLTIKKTRVLHLPFKHSIVSLVSPTTALVMQYSKAVLLGIITIISYSIRSTDEDHGPTPANKT